MNATPGILRAAFSSAFALLLVAGCGGTPDDGPKGNDRAGLKRNVLTSADEFPPHILKVAQKNFPDVKYDGGWENLRADGSVESYEVRGTSRKTLKMRTLRISPDGVLRAQE